MTGETIQVAQTISKGFWWSMFLGKNFRWGWTILIIPLLSIHAVKVSVEEKSPLPVLKEIGFRIFFSDALIEDYMDKIQNDPATLSFEGNFISDVSTIINYIYLWLSIFSNIWFLYVSWSILVWFFMWIGGIMEEQKFIIQLMCIVIVIGLQVWASRYFFIENNSGKQLPEYSTTDKIAMNMPMSGTIDFIKYLIQKSDQAYGMINIEKYSVANKTGV